MNRPWQVWLVFLVCVAGAAAAMIWLTQQALRADELRRAAEAETELEQRVSLALWRMDTELAPIIAEEVIRPAAAYRPGETAVEPPPYVLLQFAARDKGFWWTPQQPMTQSRELPRLIELREAVDLPRLLAELPDTPLPTAAEVNQSRQVANIPAANESGGEEDSLQFLEDNTANLPPQSQERQTEKPIGKQTSKMSKVADFEQRGKRYQSAAQQSLLNYQQQAVQLPADGDVNEQVGVSRPVWIGDRLILARRVGGNGDTVVQGAWLDWPGLKKRLLAEAAELLPGADLAPADNVATDDPSRMLAGLPVRLVVGEVPATSVVSPTLSWALWMGWGAVALAVLAAAALLHGVMTLSERRAAFVSSVTHELRTPLTTFRMYSEMLARGMVPDAARRQEYFNTLQRESERLTLLVENVLAYARLERGRKPQGRDRVTLKALLERVGPRLAHRAAQADMKCDLRLEVHAADLEFTTDQSVVEQILFNLVDNAAKYARDADDRQIHVEASRNGEWIKLVVRDHGPGIEQRPWGRPPRAFGKTAEQSAETAPGVGLGLALCRRLARQLGGRLEIEKANGGGAAVKLLLPVSSHQ
jgi:signal transduction histidine kinase